MFNTPWHLLANCGRLILLAVCCGAGIVVAGKSGQAQQARPRTVFDSQVLFPSQNGLAKFGKPEGSASIAGVSVNGRQIGYAFSTWDITKSVGYSGQPIDVHVGLNLEGKITGAKLVSHQEPILVIGVSASDLEALVNGMAGIDVRAAANARRADRRKRGPDHIAGATVSSAVIKDAVIRAARRVARAKGIIGSVSTERSKVDRAQYESQSWQQLLQRQAIGRLTVNRGQVAKSLDMPEEEPEKVFLDIYVALLTPPTIGRNLLGQRKFETAMAAAAANEHAVLIAANGLYSFKGTSYRRKGFFDRIQIVQGSKTIRLHKDDYSFIEKLAIAGAPGFREIGVFRMKSDAGFRGSSPWRLQVLVERTADDGRVRTVMFELDYRLPAKFTVKPETAVDAKQDVETLPSLAETMWRDQQLQIIFVTGMILVLIAVLLFHDALARRTRAYRQFRIVYLVCTFAILGVYAGAQISIVNVIAFLKALLGEFRWENFLLSPMSFIIWSFVALSLLFWGRGVFCGWLCPFGALQELANEIAKRVGVRQLHVPWPIHERLWPIKYIAFLLIVGIALRSTADAYRMAEIEPFKTAIAMKLMREWPYVLYVLLLIAIGLFIERFYCRYLCPLGAGLAIPAKLRLFEWLKRRPQCGSECHICETRCTVQAINPLGQINPNECIYCLKCQANYYDVDTCVVLKRRAARRGVSADPKMPAIGQSKDERHVANWAYAPACIDDFGCDVCVPRQCSKIADGLARLV